METHDSRSRTSTHLRPATWSRIGGAALLATTISLAWACTQPANGPTAPTVAVTPATDSRGAGQGNTPAQLTAAGWTCLDVPGHGVHCIAAGVEIGTNVSLQTKVFDTTDPSDDDAPFLGTESLIRADKYQGQPCLPGHGQYFLLPFGYYACHHFDF